MDRKNHVSYAVTLSVGLKKREKLYQFLKSKTTIIQSWYHKKVLSKTFYLNGLRVRCFSRSLKLEPPYKTTLFTLSREKVNFIINTHAKTLDPVVETLDSANCTIHWIEIYPVVSATQPLNN